MCIRIDKTCSCGKKHSEIPADAKVNQMGSWWNCSCGSTLLKADTSFKIKLKEMMDEKRQNSNSKN